MKKFLTKENLKLIDSCIINVVLLCIYLRALLFENIFVPNLVFALPLSYLAIRKYIWAQLILAFWIIVRIVYWTPIDYISLVELVILSLVMIILLPQIYLSLKYIFTNNQPNALIKFFLYPKTSGTTIVYDMMIAFVIALIAFVLLEGAF